MGCVPKAQAKPRIPNLSESLPLLNKGRIPDSILTQFQRGFTLGSKTVPPIRVPRPELALRSKHDFDCLTAQKFKYDIGSNETPTLRASLSNHFLFRHISKETLDYLIQKIDYFVLNSKEIIFNQGDPGYNFFVVASGRVELRIANRQVKVLEKGDMFGELALIHNSGRRAEARALSKVRLWGLGRDAFKKAIAEANSAKFAENKEYLVKIPAFMMLSAGQIEGLIDGAVLETYEENEKIISDGDFTNELYVIKEGFVNIFKNSVLVNKLSEGSYFGEHSVLYNTRRTADIIAGSRLSVMCFTQELFHRIMGTRLETFFYHNAIRMACSKDPIMQKLTNLQINRLIPLIMIEDLSGETQIDLNSVMVIVLKGELTCGDEGQTWKVLDCIDSNVMLQNCKKIIKLHSSDAIISKITRENLEASLEMSLQERIESNKILVVMNKSYISQLLPQEITERIFPCISLKSFGSNEVIYAEGDTTDSFYIIHHGEVQISKQGQVIKTIRSGKSFGEAVIFHPKRESKAITVNPTELISIDKDDLFPLIDSSMVKYLSKKLSIRESSINLNDLEIISRLSEGQYSKTFLVNLPSKSIYFALRSIPKELVIELNLIPILIKQRNLHKAIHFPFIGFLQKTFASPSSLYFLSEYIPGPSISMLIEERKTLSMKLSKFYTSVMLLTLIHLHENNIIHRDITSESFLIDETGYPILVHMTNAKIFEERSYTILGNPFYLAPEVINGKGYTFYADLWSLGVVIYEMLYGVLPFGQGKEDPLEIYESILNESCRYPVFVKESMKPKGIIEKLFDRNEANRGTAENLKLHPWFEGIVWEDLVRKAIVSEYLPIIVKHEGNFIDEVLPTEEAEDDMQWAEGFV